MPGTIATKIIDISAKIIPVMKRNGTTKIIKADFTSPNKEITIMIVVP